MILPSCVTGYPLPPAMRRLATGLLMLLLSPAAVPQQGNIERFDDWIYYEIPSESAEPAVHVVETVRQVAGVSLIYSCSKDIDAPRESMLLLNDGFSRVPEDATFDSTFTFARGNDRAYADATLHADPAHASLDIDHAAISGLIRLMRGYDAFIITEGDEAITAIAIPLPGFDRAISRAQQDCRGGNP